MLSLAAPARRAVVGAVLSLSVLVAGWPGVAADQQPAAAGQQLSVLARWTFASADGWSALDAATVALDRGAGRGGSSALALTSAGPPARAVSGRFRVVPGDRYLAAAWAAAATDARHVRLGLRFFDARGALMRTAITAGQSTLDRAGSWTLLHRVVAVAPAGAATAEVLFVANGAPQGEAHLLDDVVLWHESGRPAAIHGPLHTSGPHIVDADGRVVTLRGLSISGYERARSDAVPVRMDEVVTAQQWGANFVRIPLAENPVLPGDCAYNAKYLTPVDAFVHAVTSRGMVALLDLHTNAVKPCAPTQQQTMPDVRAVTFWKTVANRYKNNTLVAFDLYNEPHDVSDRVWHDGGATTSSGVTYVAAGMQALYNAVRSTGATNLVVASGTDWAADFPATAPLTGTFNLVYAVHAYTCPHGTPSSGALCTPGPQGVYDPTRILGHFRAVAGWMPVMVTEFGWPDRGDGVFLDNVISYAEEQHWAGWSGWAFDGTTRNAFDLIRDGSSSEPTPTGMSLISGFARN